MFLDPEFKVRITSAERIRFQVLVFDVHVLNEPGSFR